MVRKIIRFQTNFYEYRNRIGSRIKRCATPPDIYNILIPYYSFFTHCDDDLTDRIWQSVLLVKG